MPTLEEKIRDFLDDLNQIDFKNITYFILRPPKTNQDERDKLTNHCKFFLHDDRPMFGFMPESDLPNYIRKQCWGRYGHYFEDGGILGNFFKGKHG